MQLSDLVDAGLLRAGQQLIWRRPRLGVEYRAAVTETGIRLEDGREFASPSRAAIEAAQIAAYDGWYAWRVDADGGETLHDLRIRLAQQTSQSAT